MCRKQGAVLQSLFLALRVRAPLSAWTTRARAAPEGAAADQAPRERQGRPAMPRRSAAAAAEAEEGPEVLLCAPTWRTPHFMYAFCEKHGKPRPPAEQRGAPPTRSEPCTRGEAAAAAPAGRLTTRVSASGKKATLLAHDWRSSSRSAAGARALWRASRPSFPAARSTI